ncbi:MAG TPA: sodium:proton antiporter, partial [Microbacterium ginsengisoli]|nr:sodium:proton antiporter [Microbacterium ginsengisoli]
AATVADRPVRVELGVMTPAQRAALTERLRAGRPRGIPFTADSLTRVIAVTSGKGGVGK